MTSDGDRQDAVLIRVGERGAIASFVFHQHYTLDETLELFDELRFAYWDLPLLQGGA